MAQTEIKDGQYPPAVEMARSIVTSQPRLPELVGTRIGKCVV
jgi:hypothetical protein